MTTHPTRLGRVLRTSGLATLVALLALCLAMPALAAKETKEGKSKTAVQAKPAKAKGSFDFDDVVQMAAKLAAAPYKEPESKVPSFLLGSEEPWRVIRFRMDKAMWLNEKIPYWVNFFHAGSYYDKTVALNYIENGKVHAIPFKKELFDYGGLARQDEIPSDLGYAGFRVHGFLNRPDKDDEILVFLGASYLRALAKGSVYGLSARGLAIDTAEPKGEEFPWFKEFWIVKPGPKDKTVTVYALLDSPSAVGAYRYVTTPGQPTVLEVSSVVTLRKPVIKLGIGTLTSMFMFGENSAGRRFDDWRPEVHDSDGLLMQLVNGEWIWRPIQNPKTLQVNAFLAPGLKGFGLFQRDREFDNYQDLITRQELRPSAWVEPIGDWGDGSVELVQIPSDNENNDNLVAYWRPAKLPEPGKPISWNYRIYWGDTFKNVPPEGYVTATHIGRDLDGKSRVFVLDFEGPKLSKLPEDAPVQASVSVSPGATITEQKLEKNPVTNGWRLTFKILPEDPQGLNLVLDKRPPLELRAFLRDETHTLTETWSYAYKL